jgi:phosphoribosylformylglycinamidine synthase
MAMEKTSEAYRSMGLNATEYASILELLGREPTYTELGMFAVMWSEHCGYKYSRPVLAYFKKYKEALEGLGLENAGLVDIGDGLGVTMKVESHNHPSAVEPYQGAATGVGGIIRDILTMGARPIASLNSLRFGPIEEGRAAPEVVARNRYLMEHVVAGIAGYGNCVGVPTVAGEVNFHPRYSGNPLVNAMCVGVLNLEDLTTAAASGEGNPVLYLGSATGRDGIHGATFASDTLGEDNDAKRPNVQIGDPFAEKQLIEATLESLQKGVIVAIQDMGAAGLTCSTIEMSSKGAVGMEIDLDLVPMRENDMTAYELMLSESQERMLAVVRKGCEGEVIDVFRKWGLKAVVIGKVVNEPVLTVRRSGEIAAALDPRLLTDHCPTYESASEPPPQFIRAQNFDPVGLPDIDPETALLRLLAWPDIASKQWVYRQYDQEVQTQTAILCGHGDAAVLALRGTDKGIALKIDGNARHTFGHPYRGGMLAVAEAARNVACTGARPVAITDGLNFGDPQSPNVYWQFDQAVKGIAEAAEAMDTPVISGNVSFYNLSDLGEVPPTPVIGMLGLLEESSKRVGLAPGRASELALISTPITVEQCGLGASAYAAMLGVEDGYPEAPNLAGEKALCALLADSVEAGWLNSAHDLSEGGLVVAAAEIALAGCAVVLDLPKVSGPSGVASRLFGEFPGQVLAGLAVPFEQFSIEAAAAGLACSLVGRCAPGAGLAISMGGRSVVDLEGNSMQGAYNSALAVFEGAH